MGSRHATSGAAAHLAIALIPQLPPVSLALFTVVGAGFSVLPDIDHPDSGIARCLGPATRALAWTVNKISGGHRNGTHSAAGAAAFTVLGFEMATAYTGQLAHLAAGGAIAAAELAVGYVWGRRLQGGRPRPRAYPTRLRAWTAAGVLAATYAAVAVAGVLGGRTAGAWMLGALIALALAALLRAWLPLKRLLNKVPFPGNLADELAPFAAAWALIGQGVDLTLVPYALALGVVVHIAGDAPTVQGCPLGWPWSQKQVGPPRRFATGGRIERAVGWCLWAAVLGLLFVQVGAGPAGGA